MRNKAVREIIKEYLIKHGYDGLYETKHNECACEVDDLIPCDGECADCAPGYKITCNNLEECYFGDYPHWHIVPEKKNEEA